MEDGAKDNRTVLTDDDDDNDSLPAESATNLDVDSPQMKKKRIEDVEIITESSNDTAGVQNGVEAMEVDETLTVQDSIEGIESEAHDAEANTQVERSDSPLIVQPDKQSAAFIEAQVRMLDEYNRNAPSPDVHAANDKGASYGPSCAFVGESGYHDSGATVAAQIDLGCGHHDFEAEAERNCTECKLLSLEDKRKRGLATRTEEDMLARLRKQQDDALFVRDSDVEFQHPASPRYSEPVKRFQGSMRRRGTSRREVRGSTNGVSKDPPRRQRQIRAHGDVSWPTMLNTESLGQNDLVAQAQRNAGLPSQPGFNSTRKKEALAQIAAREPRFRGTIKALDESCKAFKSRGPGSMQADGQDGWRLKGMETSLLHFQLLGGAWAIGRERSEAAPFGGILADEMGLGKTIQMLSVMVENPPKPGATNRITLVVCPPSICDQWLEEIRKHVSRETFQGVVQYRSSARMNGLDVVDMLSRFSVIITTYHEVMSSYPSAEPPKYLATEEMKDKWWQTYYADNCGPLLKMRFHRIVLDEAHLIKNPDTRTSKACRALAGKYRWALTGTPLSNCMEELYPYFNFLGVTGASDLQLFSSNYCKRDKLSTERLISVLKTVMIRRTHGDTLFGLPLVTLPNIDHATVHLVFDPLEKTIYDIVHKRFIEKLNTWSMSGGLQKNSRHVFVMLMRLRQMCSHILMVSKPIRDLLEVEDIEELRGLITRETPGSARKQRVQVVQQFLRKAQDEKEFRGHAGPNDSATIMDSVNLTINQGDFKYETLLQSLKGHVANGETSQENAGFHLDDIPEEHDEDKNDMSWLNLPGAHLMSTKAQAVKSLLQDWLTIGPSDTKVVVFSLWIPMLKVLGQLCTDHGWGSQEYTGKMNSAARRQALRKWKAADGTKQVLLSSMGAGGLGLNLTEANYVILVDPWWNAALENQACCRVYRIGQQRPCVIRKLVIEDAIDTQFMLELQQRKTAEINKVIDGRRKTTNSLEDVMRLLGPVRRDPATNEPVIVVGEGASGFVTGEDNHVQCDSDTEDAIRVPEREL